MRILTIDRSKWLRGVQESSCLLNADGEMCCLGFDAIAQGFSQDEILYEMSPAGLAAATFGAQEDPRYAEYFMMRVLPNDEYSPVNAGLVDQAMHINDDPGLLDAEREAQLTPILLALGYDRIEFIDGEPA